MEAKTVVVNIILRVSYYIMQELKTVFCSFIKAFSRIHGARTVSEPSQGLETNVNLHVGISRARKSEP